ncbi:chromosome segregation protein SMC [Cytophagales bacterium LB-30]|uniref:Chromosome segregation protein SMC n=1 Tax=Shiella aurantiaca TaxID=3058365 RepID=A0ABT8F476_9BACT|nr:chromosome segregation protein SMC [Shiella aurantiaca]MDN4165250.1 chromosome segregation protein SMC [Shiella aurantiaca]
MSETVRPEETKKKSNNVLLALLGVLSIALLVTAYLFYQRENELQTEISQKNVELEETYNKLESISNELDMKIQEISKLGGDIEELKLAKEQVEKEKEQLRRAKNFTEKQLNDFKSRATGYEELLKMKDEEIVKLKTMTEELLSENTGLKTETNRLTDSLKSAKQTKQQMAEKLAIAATLKAENVKIYAVSDKGREREDEFKNRHIDKIKVEFNLAENKVAPIEGKDIIIRIIDPADEVLFDVATGSGSFMIDGKEQFYTSKQEILFDNSRQKLTFFYKKGSEYKTGKHKLEIYEGTTLIGSSSFTVK